MFGHRSRAYGAADDYDALSAAAGQGSTRPWGSPRGENRGAGAALRGRRGSVTAFVIGIVAIGLVAFAVVVGAGVAAVRELASDEAVDQARNLTEVDAHELELRITDAMVDGSHPAASARLAGMVEQDVLPHPGGPVARVKIWKVRGNVGEIVYSDLPRLIGLRERLDEEQYGVLSTGAVAAAVARLDRNEERSERGLGPLTEVYTRIHTPNGTPLLVETYRRESAIADTGRDLAAAFTPVVILTLLGAAAVQLLLAALVIGRVRHHQREREGLMAAAIDASAKERRKIAGDLHDGPVQEMAGLCLCLDAQAQIETDERVRGTLRQMAASSRATLRTLRSAIVGLYPPNLDQVGLDGALSDLLSRLPTHQIRGHLDYRLSDRLGLQTSELLYRTSQEAIRNIEKHAAASNVWINVHRQNGSAVLTVRDDGTGGATINPQITTSGRFGLAVLADIIRDAGGRMHLTSTSTGTTLTVHVPA